MINMRSSETTLAAICTMALLAHALPVTAQQASNQPLKEDKTQTISPPQSQQDTQRGWPQLVEVDNSANKSKVGVHVPIFFDMTNDNSNGKSKLDLSVLSGLVTVNRDKSKQPNGQYTGPLTVHVFGIPVYSGMATSNQKQVKSSFFEKMRAKEAIESSFVDKMNAKEALQSSERSSQPAKAKEVNLLELPGDVGLAVYDKIGPAVHKTSENVLKSFANMLSKTAEKINQQAEPIKNLNGEPIVNKDNKYVAKSKFLASDFEPKGTEKSEPHISAHI